MTLQELNQIGPESPKYVPVVPESTTFTVFPFNNYMPQLEFAAKVEKVLIQSGLHVVSAQRGIKEVEERKGAGIAQDNGSPRSSETSTERTESQSLLIERYTKYEDTKADYFIETMLTGAEGTIRFSRRSDRKVIGVFTVYEYEYILEKDMLAQLAKMQFIKEVKDNVQP